jgi:archaellum biogenesis ATPase FlaH
VLDKYIKEFSFDPNTEPERAESIVSVYNNTVATLGNVITMSGRSGVRKSTFLHAFIGSYLINKEVYNLRVKAPHDHRNKIILIDTEQSAYSLFNQMKRLKKATNIIDLDSRLIIYRLRTLDAEEVKTFIKKIIEYHNDAFMICVDNILDMVLDYNNISETKLLMDYFKQLTDLYNIVLFCIIHQSKSTAFSIGHVGSRLEALAQTSLRVQYGELTKDLPDKHVSELVVGEKIRDTSAFPPVSIKFDIEKGKYIAF